MNSFFCYMPESEHFSLKWGIGEFIRKNQKWLVNLLGIFPNKPKSTPSHKFDNTYVFGELDYINKLRNRIAYHEPICFSKNPVSIDTKYIHNRYNRIMEIFRWMDIDGASLLYGLGHIDNACNQIDALLK